MAFELLTKTTARVLDVRTLASKDRRPDEPPGAQLLLQADLPVEVLAMFDGYLPGMLFRKSGGGQQAKLEGLEGLELTAIGEHVTRLRWEYEQTGVALTILRATARSNISLDDCKVHRVNLKPLKTGGVRAQWTVDAPALSDETRGKLTGFKSTDIDITLAGPQVDESQQGIPGTEGTDPDAKPKGGWPFPKTASKDAEPATDATEAFVSANTPELPPERQVGDVPVSTRRSRAVIPPPSAH